MTTEQAREFANNPSNISPETVNVIKAQLEGLEPNKYLDKLLNNGFRNNKFTELLSMEFQIFRMGALGFKIDIDEADRAQYGIVLDSIDSNGPDYDKVDDELKQNEEVTDWGWDFWDALNTMRTFVAGHFYLEAEKRGFPEPRVNSALIDPTPAKKEWIASAVASHPEMYLFIWEEFEERWNTESPEMHKEALKLKDSLVEYYTQKTLNAYKNLPEEYKTKIAPDVKEGWDRNIMDAALRTYAMFIPNPPILIEVTNVKSDSK